MTNNFNTGSLWLILQEILYKDLNREPVMSMFFSRLYNFIIQRTSRVTVLKNDEKIKT
jgi:hypothetical protein